MSASVEVTYTFSVAVELELEASTLSLPPEYSASWIETVSVVDEGAVTVSVAVRVTPPNEAEIVADVEEATDVVVTVNVSLVCPAGTVTLAGTVAAVALLESETTEPPSAAAPLRVTVPVEELPPATLVGLRLSDDNVGAAPGGFTVRTAWRWVKYQALIVTAVDAETDAVVTVKVALVWPPGTLTKEGTVATAVLLLFSSTARPPAGAAAVRVTFPVEEPPPVTLAGVSVSDESVGPDGAGLTRIVCVRVSPPAEAEMIDQ
jgi:hypothetical protein